MTAAQSNPTPTGLPLAPDAYRQATACIHCGLCLPACPTYAQNGLEGDSPRGRIYLMKALADGRLDAEPAALRHLDLCLDCRACETACPSGVVYHKLIEDTRAKLNERAILKRPPWLVERLIYHVMPYPRRLKAALLPARLLQRLGLWRAVTKLAGRILPDGMTKMHRMLPPSGPLWPAALDERYPAAGQRKMTVGLLTGCVGSVLQQPLNRMMIELLRQLGCEVVVPRRQACCGAIHHHGGRPEQAIAFARQNFDAFTGVDAIVTAIAGCGAMLKEYGDLARHHGDAGLTARADAFAAKSRDICELIASLDLPAPSHRVERAVTYHDACHLAHAQKITDAPRRLLAMIPGLRMVALPESQMCCGAAGTYNLTEPEMAAQIGERKLRHIQSTGCDTVVTGNIGCAMQIAGEAARLGVALEVVHPVELLHEAWCGRGD